MQVQGDHSSHLVGRRQVPSTEPEQAAAEQLSRGHFAFTGDSLNHTIMGSSASIREQNQPGVPLETTPIPAIRRRRRRRRRTTTASKSPNQSNLKSLLPRSAPEIHLREPITRRPETEPPARKPPIGPTSPHHRTGRTHARDGIEERGLGIGGGGVTFPGAARGPRGRRRRSSARRSSVSPPARGRGEGLVSLARSSPRTRNRFPHRGNEDWVIEGGGCLLLRGKGERVAGIYRRW